MHRDYLNRQGRLLILMVGSVLVLFVTWGRIDRTGFSKTETHRNGPSERESEPVVIWYYHSTRDPLDSLKLALSSGLITHVSIAGPLHRYDFDYKKNEKTLKAVRFVKNSGAKLIWLQVLWPMYNVEKSRVSDLFDRDYYTREIRALRAEGRELGADFVGLDTEPYGYAPVKEYIKKRDKLSAKQRERLKKVIAEVREGVGKVDFVLPAGSMVKTHPYNILAELGENRIAENTYFASEKVIRNVKYPYEILGAYVNTVRHDEASPQWPYFLPSEVFEKSHWWSGKKGVFIYPRERKALEVAKELVSYANQLPHREQDRPNRRK